jgi:transposase
MKEARESGIKELNSFVNGIEQDYDAGRAGFTFHWSQGTNWQLSRKKKLPP